jgi:protein-tyrosine phosphatase
VVLLVCTGNICRSPMAEGLLRARFADRGIDATVSSAGLAFDDRPATPDAIRAASAHAVDIRDHRSRIIDASMVSAADLIIGMERMHVREAIVLSRERAGRCFTLKELVRRSADAGPRAPGESLERWLERVAAGRRTMDLLGESAADEVADPYRQSEAVYQRCVAEIADLVDQLVGLGWPGASEGVA